MKAKRFERIFGIVLIAAMALTMAGCSDSKTEESSQATEAATTQATEAATASEQAEVASDKTVIGEGETSFDFSVTDADGNESLFEVHTDETTVGAALLECDMIAGDDSEYGLYVKTVNGITVDYDTDGKYWAFYVDGEYASTGVDMTDITEGSSYAFKVE